MKPTSRLLSSALALLAMTLLCIACATSLPPMVVPAPRLPLPKEARQPVPEPICVPTCLAGLQRTLDELLSLLESATSPAKSASAPASR